MKDKKTLMLVEIAVMVAFSYVLSLFRVVEMPQGGSVSLQMLPLFVVALRWGGKAGIVAGLLFSGLKLIVEPFIVHPVQLLLDYPFAFAAIGLAGFFKDKPIAGVAIGGLARFVMHFASGVVFFGQYAPEGTSIYAFSFIYNITYMGPEIIIALFTAPLLLRRLSKDKSEDYSLENNLIEILSFAAPLAAMALVVGLRESIPVINYVSLILWGGLLLYHLSKFQQAPEKAKRGLILVTVPPALVYLASLLLR